MNKIKNKITLSPIAGLKANENWIYNSPKKLHHGLLDEKEAKVIDKVHLFLTDQNKSFKTAESAQGKSFDAARNSGQRQFAKKNSRRSHYITKK